MSRFSTSEQKHIERDDEMALILLKRKISKLPIPGLPGLPWAPRGPVCSKAPRRSRSSAASSSATSKGGIR